MQRPTRYEALLQVRSHYRTDAAMAADFGVSQPTVWRWINQSKQLPAEKALLAEKLTGVPRHWLRPDIYPAETVAIPASTMGEETPLCGSILTARMLAKHGNTHAVLPRKDVA
ncbi:transcriptional regulator [Croceicoccus estronivorus]|uniref:transcriptional regulator n=1 Tax=Croceicoccus estronivorus TaxID=1172626 RepID=UPI0009EF0E29|nr:YdaS family helix-turn-helix protein [Croceicoccus estronivorus]